MKKGIYAGLAILTVFAMIFGMAGCPTDTGGDDDIAVTFSALTADGSAASTTTQLTLTFNKAITGLAAGDITLGGSTGATKGALSGSGPAYTLAITGVTGSGDVTVTVKKSGYKISGSTKTVPIFFKAATYTITFDLNGGTGTPPTAATVTAGQPVTLPPGTGLTGPTGKPNFLGWNTSTTDTTVLTTYTPTATGTLYAVWTAAATYTITFDLNGGTGTPPIAATVTVGQPVTLPPGTGLTGPTGKPNFVGWNTTTTATTALTAYTPTATGTLYAVWEAGPVGPIPGPGDNDIVEELTLNNGWFAIYQFTLPSGKSWEDYQYLTADYKIADVSTQVRARVLGNYTATEVAEVRLGTSTVETVDYKIAVVGSWPGGRSNGWIMSNTYGAGGTSASTHFASSDPAPADNAWFTVQYNVKGGFFGDWNAGVYAGGTPNNNPTDGPVIGRVPVAVDAGPFYFAVGLTPAAGGSPVTSQVTRVTLVGYEDVADVIGMPLYFKDGSTLHRAYAGQLDDDGSLQGGTPKWGIISGSDKVVPITYVEPAPITITLNPQGGTLVTTSYSIKPGYSLSGAQLTAPTPPAHTNSPAKEYIFKQWYTVATGTGGAVVNTNTKFSAAATIYAIYEEVEPIKITFKGTSDSEVTIPYGGSLTAAQLTTAKPTVGTGTFGGWYTTDTSAGAFNYADYTKLVSVFTKFTVDTDLYAYWYTPGSTGVGGITVEGLGGAVIDKDGYVIMAGDDYNAYYGASGNDSLLSFVADFTSVAYTDKTKVKITYSLKKIIEPSVPADYTLDAAGIWKAGYNSWNNSTLSPVPEGGSGSYFSFDLAGGDLTRFISQFTNNDGVSIQINKGDDANNKQTRLGFVYGIKITAITFE